MRTDLNDDNAKALAAVVRDALVDGHEMKVPGLGTFGVRHEPSRINDQVEGREEMIPPRDVVAFEPEAGI